MTFKEIYNQINDYLKDESKWTKKEIALMMERAEEEWDLAVYKQVLIENAAKMVVKLMKKKVRKGVSTIQIYEQI